MNAQSMPLIFNAHQFDSQKSHDNLTRKPAPGDKPTSEVAMARQPEMEESKGTYQGVPFDKTYIVQGRDFNQLDELQEVDATASRYTRGAMQGQGDHNVQQQFDSEANKSDSYNNVAMSAGPI